MHLKDILATGFASTCLLALIALGIWWYRGDTTWQDFGEILFWCSVALCMIGGYMARGADRSLYVGNEFVEHYAMDEELRRMHAVERDKGRSVGLAIFLAGLIPGIVALLILHFSA